MTLTSPDIPFETVSRDGLFERLRAGHVFVTANNRLARVLAEQYRHWRARRGDRLWRSPAIQSWETWLDQLWESAGLQGMTGARYAVPRGQQLLNLWENVLLGDAPAQMLLRPESLASQLRDTRRQVIDWKLDLSHPAWFGSGGHVHENHEAFHRWNRSFEDLCRRDGWIAPEDRAPLISRAIMGSKFKPGQTIDLLGFDEFNPAQAELIGALAGSGSCISRLAIAPAASHGVLCRIRSSGEELQVMARWVRHWIEAEPDSRIAVVVPDLQARRAEVERSLTEILLPGDDLPAPMTKPWNTSMGSPLAQHPMIQAAFDLFSLLDRPVDIQVAGRVLRSPWILGAAAERSSRALLEKCLRECYPRQLGLGEIRWRAGEMRKYDSDRQELPADQCTPQPWHCPQMLAVINTLMGFGRDNQDNRRASEWAESFDRLLAALGWPLQDASVEGRFDHEADWQAFQAWQSALRELASLDAVATVLERGAAIGHLRRICRDHIFQSRSAPANIQVLGLYEASGLRFDHLWVLGLHHGNWPPAARPDPFIPPVLQREAGIPHSSPQRELGVARIVTGRLLETASDAVFSYPEQVDGDPVLPSPLLRSLPICRAVDLPQWAGDSWLQTVHKETGPRIENLVMPGRIRAGAARGGSSIIRNQALCPFRAFAGSRLGASGLETPISGISALQHGQFLHRVLERFWKETQTQEALLQMDGKRLADRLRTHIEEVLQDERALKFRPAFGQVEAERLHRLAMNSMELERERASFEVVGFEKEVRYEIEGQTIRLVIDRIDRLESGDEIIIDYKTGRVDPRKWFGDRPEDPQLPLYAISAEKPPAALVFFVIRDAACQYRGIVREAGIFPGLPPRATRSNGYLVDAGHQLPATIEDWRRTLHGLMKEFLAGEAYIDPKEGRAGTCIRSYCEFQPLCRIGELEGILESDSPGERPEDQA